MKRDVLLLVTLLSCTMAFAQDSLRTDTIKHSELRMLGEKISHTIKETVRGFDRTNDDYIEPQHFEFTVMMQVTRTFESFDLSSNNQHIRLSVFWLALVLLRLHVRYQEPEFRKWRTAKRVRSQHLLVADRCGYLLSPVW